MLEVGLHVNISGRDGSRRGGRSRPAPPPLAPGGRWSLGRRARGRPRADRRGPAPTPPRRSRRSRRRAARRDISDEAAERGRRLEPLRGRPLRSLRDDQDLLRDEDGRRVAGGSGDATRGRPHPRDGRAGRGQRLLQDPAGPVRRVRLERRADDARGDHAAAHAVLPLQHLRGLVLVPLRDRAAADRDGPQARQVAVASPHPRRALARGAGAHEPAFSARAGAVLVARPLLEVVLHRGGRRAQDLGALLAPAAAQARHRGGARVAGGAHGGARRSGWHLSGHGQRDPRPAPARSAGRSSARARPDQGDRGARRGSRRRAVLPALPLARVGHLAGRQRAHRERSAARSPGAAARGRVDAEQAGPRPRRLEGEAAARAAGRLGLSVRQRLLPGPRRRGHGTDGAREDPRHGRRPCAAGQGARRRLVPRDAERGRRLGRTVRELREARAGRYRRVAAEPDGVGAAGPLRRRAHDRPGGRAGNRISDGHPAGGRLVGGSLLERHRLSARLLPEISPLREVLPTLGSRRVSSRPEMSEPALSAVLRPLDLLGEWAISLAASLGRFGTFLSAALAAMVTPPLKFWAFVDRINFIGFRSLLIILLTGGFTGMVLGLQIFFTLSRFGSEAFLGPAVALSLIRELGPVLAALMVTGRAGSALTAELGIMRITEQIDALEVMALSPMRYLVAPSIFAGILTLPLMTAIFDVLGIFGGYLVGVELLGLSPGTYFGEMQTFVDFA